MKKTASTKRAPRVRFNNSVPALFKVTITDENGDTYERNVAAYGDAAAREAALADWLSSEIECRDDARKAGEDYAIPAVAYCEIAIVNDDIDLIVPRGGK